MSCHCLALTYCIFESGTHQYIAVVRKRDIYHMTPLSESVPKGHGRTAKGLHCPLTESLNSTECMNRVQRPGWYFTQLQDVLCLRILHMFEGTFSLDRPNMWAVTCSIVPSMCALRRLGSAYVCNSYICVMREKGIYITGEQQRSRWARASVQSDLNISVQRHILYEYAGWLGPALSANCITVLFVRYASHDF